MITGIIFLLIGVPVALVAGTQLGMLADQWLDNNFKNVEE